MKMSTVWLGSVLVDAGVLASCVPANEKKRKRKVPTNSPTTAVTLLRAPDCAFRMGSRLVFVRVGGTPAGAAAVGDPGAAEVCLLER
ncbi:hypothetical protein HYQ46_009600 [Verticillium longisporum]|nr:hypothetical protein HYQ46_009600 [Verticillium longisporum]